MWVPALLRYSESSCFDSEISLFYEFLFKTESRLHNILSAINIKVLVFHVTVSDPLKLLEKQKKRFKRWEKIIQKRKSFAASGDLISFWGNADSNQTSYTA